MVTAFFTALAISLARMRKTLHVYAIPLLQTHSHFLASKIYQVLRCSEYILPVLHPTCYSIKNLQQLPILANDIASKCILTVQHTEVPPMTHQRL